MTIAALIVFLGTAPLIGPPPGKVVFLKGNEVVTAAADGSDLKVLTFDNLPKMNPVWSPDGQKIAYLIPGAESSDPKTHANIAIISSTGALQTTVPVLSTEADGTIIGGMRFVEAFGWFGNGAIFAMGSVNPHIAEYRILDASSSKFIQSYFGYDFVTCADQAKVAYVAESLGVGSKGIHIEVQGTTVYAPPPGDTLRGLQWSTDCQRLAFLQTGRANVKLMLLGFTGQSAEVEVNLSLRKELSNPTLIPVASSFLLTTDAVGFIYDNATRSLQRASEIFNALQNQQQRRDILIHDLGGDSPNWWISEKER